MPRSAGRGDWMWVWMVLAGCTTRCEKLEAVGYPGRTCPAGDLLLSAEISVSNVQRNSFGMIVINPLVNWMVDQPFKSNRETRPFLGEVAVTAHLDGTDTPVELTKPERIGALNGRRTARITLPDVPDGDHVLVVELDAGFDKTTVRVPLAFYDPALVHVLSDRPIYRPGEDIKLRSLVLGRADRMPLAKRPGRWTVVAVDRVTLLDERSKAGAWGVAATELPLDIDAPHGTYRATYSSGGDSDTIQFEVRPFEVPKIKLEARASQSWSKAGDPVRIEGIARYRSGAPIADAPIEATLRVKSGRWPLPWAWQQPLKATTRPDGSFVLDWGEVPKDVRDRVTVSAKIVVTEEGGERISTQAGLVFSQHPVWAKVLTELGESLAGGFNNRAYIRVMQPDGVPLALSNIRVTNPWKPAQRASTATTDEDGVISVQVDPGDPVTLVTQPMPVRTPPPEPVRPAGRPEVLSMHGSFDRNLGLVEQNVFPTIEDAVAGCSHLGDNTTVHTTLRVSNGRVGAAHGQRGAPIDRCVEEALMGMRFPVQGPETYDLEVRLPRTYIPRFTVETRTPIGTSSQAEKLFADAALHARSCLQPAVGIEGAEAAFLHWTVLEKSKRITVEMAEGKEHGLSKQALSCIRRSFASLTLDEPSEELVFGTTRLQLRVPSVPGAPTPQAPPAPTTRDGFELRLEVEQGKRTVGSTPMRFEIGTMPAVRLRATPPVVRAGESFVVEILRSGERNIELPEKLDLKQHGKLVSTIKLNGNQAVFTVSEQADGFMDVHFAGASARVFVERADQLALTLTPDKNSYRPGEMATIQLRTQAGGTGRQAAVGLAGVDDALAQLMPLPGPDAYARVTIRATSDQPAFGSFDARSLLLGRIRGANARQAAVLRVSNVPTDRFERPKVGGHGAVEPDQDTIVRDAFERAWMRTAERVRDWERSAPPEEKMQNQRMYGLWLAALADLQKTEPAVDAYGRELVLNRLPGPFIEQLDPKNMVGDTTRLPEDLVGWTHWLQTEVTDG